MKQTSTLDKEIEILKRILVQDGSCVGLSCSFCPFEQKITYDNRQYCYVGDLTPAGVMLSAKEELEKLTKEKEEVEELTEDKYIQIAEKDTYLSTVMENDQDIYKKTLEFFGVDRQLQKCCEELSELQVAIHHWKDKKATQDDVASEIADVIIMCNQLKLMLSPGLVDIQVQYKLNRLKDRIK